MASMALDKDNSILTKRHIRAKWRKVGCYVKDPSPGDFIDIVKSDCVRIGLEMTEKRYLKFPNISSEKLLNQRYQMLHSNTSWL